MKPPPTSPHEHALDFALLQQSPLRAGAHNRKALLWLLGLLTLLLGSVVLLVLYLNRFEDEEAARRRAADAQWLEQSVQFHFRRLEDDLLVLARQAVQQTHAKGEGDRGQALKAGVLWRGDGVVLSSGWLVAATPATSPSAPERWRWDMQAHPDNALALSTMQNTTQGLRRAAYAGPMLEPDGRPGPVVWLAVPYFERGQFAGNYLAAVDVQRALRNLVPAWFAQDHQVRLIGTDEQLTPTQPNAYRVAMNLPGIDLFLQVTPTQAQPATVPRIFFLVALVFLLGMLASLWALRRDFAKRQQVQALLRAQVALRTAMENSVTLGLRAWDLQGRILYVNPAFTQMVGYSAAELLGRSMPFPYWPADQVAHLQQVHQGLMAQGTDGDGVEVQFAHRDGHLLDVLIHEAPLNTDAGVQIGWMSSVLDISERKRAQRMAALQQERLEASGRLVAVGEVASTLAHELNQPLGALASFANGLLNRLGSGSITLEELPPVVQRMARLAERAGGIIARVNAFARRRELRSQRLDWAQLAGRVLAAEDENPGTRLRWSLPEQAVWIHADELLLEHLMTNLLSNARYWATQTQQPVPDAAQAQVWVQLRADAASSMAVLAVSDTGPGVAADALQSIFNAFVSGKTGGMGMGLAICRSIAEAHHGHIEVMRDPLLGGARFVVHLPLDLAATQTTATASPMPPNSPDLPP